MKGITEVDIIILSYAYNTALKLMTENCIHSLMDSEDREKIKFNVIVVESERTLDGHQYENSVTLYPDMDFGYNKFMNIGIELTSSKYLCLCNNDLIFHTNWATEILIAFDTYYDLSSASPLSPSHHEGLGFHFNTGIYPGYRNRYEIAGWCLFLKRDVLRLTGSLDENFTFWCADNDYANLMASLHLGHALVTSSIVEHLGSATSDVNFMLSKLELTSNEFFYLEKKWNSRMGQGWKLIAP